MSKRSNVVFVVAATLSSAVVLVFGGGLGALAALYGNLIDWQSALGNVGISVSVGTQKSKRQSRALTNHQKSSLGSFCRSACQCEKDETWQRDRFRNDHVNSHPRMQDVSEIWIKTFRAIQNGRGTNIEWQSGIEVHFESATAR